MRRNCRDPARLREKLEELRERRRLYLKREAEMLDGGAQSYGVGNRNLARYNTDLATVRDTIDKLENEVGELEALLGGGSRRSAVGVVPRDDW